jgi:hypothetical protein
MEYRIYKLNKTFDFNIIWEVAIGAVNKNGEFIVKEVLFNSSVFSECLFFMKAHESGIVSLKQLR